MPGRSRRKDRWAIDRTVRYYRVTAGRVSWLVSATDKAAACQWVQGETGAPLVALSARLARPADVREFDGFRLAARERRIVRSQICYHGLFADRVRARA